MSEILVILGEEEYVWDNMEYCFYHNSRDARFHGFLLDMFQYCGKEIDLNTNDYSWRDFWLLPQEDVDELSPEMLSYWFKKLNTRVWNRITAIRLNRGTNEYTVGNSDFMSEQYLLKNYIFSEYPEV